MTRRRFNGRERAALFVAAGGACVACGAALPRNWHADHIAPYSRGGATDITNGQALCPACNLAKGSRTMMQPHAVPAGLELRKWQRQAFHTYVALNKRDFLLNATPGAGKTVFGLYVAMQSLITGECRKIQIVVPSDSLRTQWANEAHKIFGIQLAIGPMTLAGDFDGCVVTYAQVASQPLVFATLCAQQDTFVIFDEIHHAGDELRWGSQLRQAYGGAKRRLSITGTPFRSDSNSIPFVEYRDGESVADETYLYGDAIADGVCREIYFPSYEGDLRWWEREAGQLAATFADDLPEAQARRRLNTALDPAGDWMRTVLSDANAQLDLVRRDIYPHAAGLVIAKDRPHAERIGALLEEISGESVEVVTSERPDAAEAIEAFKRVPPNDQLLWDARSHPKKWIVAVRMVSEGVDIRRLYVAVYATNILTELHFRQACGRVARMQDDVDGQVAYFYIPADPELVAFAQQIKAERKHAIAEQARRERIERDRQLAMDAADAAWTPEAADAVPDDVIYDGAAYSQDELVQARANLSEAGIDQSKLSEFEAVRLWRVIAAKLGVQAASAPRERQEKPLYQRNKEVRALLKRRASQLVAELMSQGKTWGDHRFVNTMALQVTGKKVEDCSMDELYQRVDLLDFWKQMAQDAWSGYDQIEWMREARHASRSAG